MGYSFAYNNSSSPSGTTKFAKLQIGGNNREYTTYGGLNWYASAPYNGKFLIVSDTYSQGWSNQESATPTFWRSAENSLDSLKDLVNQLPDVNGVTGFTTVGGAINYINSSEKYLISQESDSYSEGDIVTSGLVFNLDAGYSNSYPKSGTTWYDTKNKYNGTFINGTSFDSSDGGCIAFDGTNDYITFGNPQLGYTDDVTVSTWVMITGHNPYNYIALKYGGGRGWILNNVDGGVFRVDGRAGSSYRVVSSNVVPNLNQWYDFTFVKSGTTWMIYINGVFNASNTFAADTSIFSNSNLFISGYGRYSDTPLDGKISSFKIYNRALSSSEILQNYNATKGRFGL